MDVSVPAQGSVLGSLVPARYILAVLGSIGMAIIYGLKVNLSVALVAMLDYDAIAASKNTVEKVVAVVTPLNATVAQLNATVAQLNATVAQLNATVEQLNATVATVAAEVVGDDACVLSDADGALENGPFVWDEKLQGIILSCYFWGYLVSQLPGARIAEMFSAKWVMFFSVAINILCTLLTPIMSGLGYGGMIVMRIGEGIGGGVTFPAMHVMLASWAPPSERSIMSSIVYAGTSLGTVISMLWAGILAANLGWASVFYVMGGLSSVWLFLWAWLVQDTPSKQPLISAEERSMIISSLGTADSHSAQKPHKSVPWGKVFTSMPFYAILIAHICSNFGWYMLLIELPFYMKDVLKFNIKDNAVATAVPFFTMWIFSMIISKSLDILREKGKISTTIARKIATLCASAIPMACLLALCYIGCKRTLAVIIMGIGVTSIGGMFCGFLSNHIDIAPNFAGTLMAITNTAATLGGIFVPVFVGLVTAQDQSIVAWRTIFFVTIALYVVEILVYTAFGTGEEQSWNKVGEGVVYFEEGTPLKGREGEQEEKNSYTVNK